MQIEQPIIFLDKDIHYICPHCEHIQYIEKNLTPTEYMDLPIYLDGFKKGMEEKYFQMKFIICENCNSFTTQPEFTGINGNNPPSKIKKILQSNIDVLEKVFLSSYMLNPFLPQLIDLYWYYDIKAKNTEKASEYRKILIKKLGKDIKINNKNMIHKAMYVDILRRNGEFKKALELATEYLKQSAYMDKPYFEKQIELCKEQNTNRY